MCSLCQEYGDPAIGGGMWYLNPKNYARSLYKLRASGEGFRGADAGPETGVRSGPTLGDLLNAMDRGEQQDVDRIRTALNNVRGHGEEGAVVPLRDAEKVMDLCTGIGIMSCACRKGTRALDQRHEYEYNCMGMGVGMLKWERWPERYKGGVKFLTPEQAKDWLRKMDKQGFCHLLMIFDPPYIGGLCQCDYPVCGIVRRAVDFGIGLIKSHYVATLDYDKCNGCGICAKRCPFGAVKYEVTTDKANIDQFRCYGCGLCDTGCTREAITLVERKSLPVLAEVWR